MADINYAISGQITKGALTQAFGGSGITATIASAGLLSMTLNLNTSVTTISTTPDACGAGLSALGLCFMRNLATASTHVVSFGRYQGTTLHSAVQLRGGEAAVLRLAPGNYAANAAVANSRAVITITEG